jgi:hypothetical protein
MRNKARIKALGVPTARNEFNTMVTMNRARASKGKDPEHSESEYDPGDDPSGEGDESVHNQTEVVTILHFLKAYHIPCSII